MTLRCLIVDDEPPAIRIVEKYLIHFPFLTHEGSYTDPFQALEYMQEQPIELLFLDINMPGLTGLQLMQSLRRPPLVIFTTAYPDYALQGFELQAVDYLLKPFSLERFTQAVLRARELAALQAGSTLPSEEAYLNIRVDRQLHRIPMSELCYLQAYGDYVKVITPRKTYLTKARLSKLAEELPAARFLQIHRSYVVALDRVRYLEGNSVCVGEEVLPVAAAYREELRRRVG